MNTPFKITFRKGIKEEEYETILNNFKINSEKSKCENVEIINDRQLFVKNGFLFDLKLWNYMNVWTGVGRADICINRNKENHETEIIYKIDVSRFFLFYLILFFIMFLFDYFEFFGFQDNDFTYSFFIFFYLGFTFLSLIPIIIRQRSFFLRTLKYGADSIVKHKWTKILEKKSEIGLQKIFNGETNLTDIVKEMAIIELEKRKNIK